LSKVSKVVICFMSVYCASLLQYVCLTVDPDDNAEEVEGLFEGDIDLQPGDNPLVSIIVF